MHLLKRSIVAVVAVILLGQRTQAAEGDWIAKAETIPIQATAFGEITPQAVITVRAGETGVLKDFAAQPGDRVVAGAVLGHLSGPSFEAILAQRQAEAASAVNAVKAAEQTASVANENAARKLAARDTVANAADALGKAQAALATAQAQLSEAQDVATLHAPSAGEILAVNAANGDRVAAGDTVLTLLPAGALLAKAVFYGTEADALRIGMSGSFMPADGAAPTPVKVSAVIGALLPDGGRTVMLRSDAADPHWLYGEAGTVTVEMGTRSGVSVPTEALILDQGKWWVLVRTAQGDKPQSVTPGPQRGATTLIEKGLAAGAEVVVANAYLEFHRGIGQNYQPPD